MEIVEKKELRPVKGSLWIRRYGRVGTPVRVMCDPIEGWVMARHRGAAPFLCHISEWNERFEPNT